MSALSSIRGEFPLVIALETDKKVFTSDPVALASPQCRGSMTSASGCGDSAYKDSPFDKRLNEISPCIERFKILYENRLGRGHTGAVYEVAPRTEKEQKSFLIKAINSAPYLWRPYLYELHDCFFRSHSSPSPDVCIKIYHSLVLQRIRGKLSHQIHANDREYIKERDINELLRRYELSTLTYYSGGPYFQFKTRVKGYTLQHYLLHKIYMQNDAFASRKALVDFLRRINDDHLVFADMHAHNIMYDNKNGIWEIIDGSVFEKDETPLPPPSEKKDNIYCHFYRENIHSFRWEKGIEPIFGELMACARKGELYTEKMDIELLTRVQKENTHFT